MGVDPSYACQPSLLSNKAEVVLSVPRWELIFELDSKNNGQIALGERRHCLKRRWHKQGGAGTQRGLLANKAERRGCRQTTEDIACQAEEFEL